MKNNNVSEHGFTLIELLVTLALIVILMTLAVPSFVAFIRNSQMTALATNMLSAMSAAKSEAMKRGKPVFVVPSDGANWGSGWIVFVDVNRDQAYSSTGDITVTTNGAAPTTVTVSGSGSASGSTPYIMYDASGFAKLKNGSFGTSVIEIARNDVSGTELLAQTRRIRIEASGSLSICTPTSSSDTNCSSS